jgi:hypothetical protein
MQSKIGNLGGDFTKKSPVRGDFSTKSPRFERPFVENFTYGYGKPFFVIKNLDV